MTAERLGMQHKWREDEKRRAALERLKPRRKDKMEQNIAYDGLGKPAAKEHTGGSG